MGCAVALIADMRPHACTHPHVHHGICSGSSFIGLSFSPSQAPTEDQLLPLEQVYRAFTSREVQ